MCLAMHSRSKRGPDYTVIFTKAAAMNQTPTSRTQWKRKQSACLQRQDSSVTRSRTTAGLGTLADTINCTQSYLDGCRFGIVEDLLTYHRTLEFGDLPIQERERLTPEQYRREAIVFGLRLIEGTDLGIVHETMDRTWEQVLDRLINQGLLEERSGRVRMTEQGRRFADSIAVELL